jgi:tetratricopeptide (TPR) repeat protein
MTLEELVAGSLPPEIAARLRVHLECCDSCCSALDQLTDDEELGSWAPATENARPTYRGEEKLVRLVSNLLATGPLDGDSVDPSEEPDIPANALLDPPDRDGDLGRIGSYRVEAELGRGGAGIVFLAHDDALRRAVAIKAVRPEFAGGHRNRLLREARAAARFRHEHAVAVHSVGETPSGLPFIVMEHIGGSSVAELIRRRGRIEPRRAVEIVEQVASALAEAHKSGLIHRDVKPGNILIDANTVRAKLVDFGLAVVVDVQTDSIREGARVFGGTPSYMSPEQARSDDSIDGRADVYSLGATFYEMLTGEPPFRGRPGMIIDQVLHDEPRPPRRLDAAIPRDLETICLKAMAKERGERYQSAHELADDLRRSRLGEPIAARPAGPVERLHRWARRHRAIAGLGVTALALLVALAVGSTAAAVRIDRARRLAVSEGRRADRKAADAVRAERLATERARVASEQRLLALETVGTLVKELQQALKPVPGTLALRRRLAEAAMSRLEKIAGDESGGADVAIARIIAHDRLGDLCLLTGRGNDARRHRERARDIAETLRHAPGKEAIEAGRQWALAVDKLGDLSHSAGDAKRAQELYAEAAAARDAMPESYKQSAEGRRERAVSANKLGDARLLAGKARAAKSAYEAGLELTRTDQDADAKRHLSDLRVSHTRLGDVELALFDFVASVGHYREAIALAERTVALDPSDGDGKRQLGVGQTKLANVLIRTGGAAEAVELHRRGLALCQEVAREDPGNLEARRNVSVSHSLLGDAFVVLRDFASAESSYRESMAICEALVREDPRSPQKANDVLIARRKLIEVAEACGGYHEAAELCQTLRDELASMQKEGAIAAPVVESIAGLLDAAIVIYRAAVDGVLENESAISSYPPLIAQAMLRIRGSNLARRGQHKQAADTAEVLRARGPNDAAILSDVARIYALCAEAIDRLESPNPPSPANQSLRARYADNAAAAIVDAVRISPALLQGSPFAPDLDAIRDHPRLKSLAPRE